MTIKEANAWFDALSAAGKVSQHLYSSAVLSSGKSTNAERTFEIRRHGVGSPIASSIIFDASRGHWNAITTRGIFVSFVKEGDEISMLLTMFPVQPWQEAFKRCTVKIKEDVKSKLIKICEANQTWNPQGYYPEELRK